MTEVARAEALWASVNLAESFFQVHVETESGRLAFTKTLRIDAELRVRSRSYTRPCAQAWWTSPCRSRGRG